MYVICTHFQLGRFHAAEASAGEHEEFHSGSLEEAIPFRTRRAAGDTASHLRVMYGMNPEVHAATKDTVARVVAVFDEQQPTEQQVQEHAAACRILKWEYRGVCLHVLLEAREDLDALKALTHKTAWLVRATRNF